MISAINTGFMTRLQQKNNNPCFGARTNYTTITSSSVKLGKDAMANIRFLDNFLRDLNKESERKTPRILALIEHFKREGISIDSSSIKIPASISNLDCAFFFKSSKVKEEINYQIKYGNQIFNIHYPQKAADGFIKLPKGSIEVGNPQELVANALELLLSKFTLPVGTPLGLVRKY